MKYTIYHLVANQGGRYTKHIYIGGERIVSKIGDFASYGPDPRRIEYAGSEADAVTLTTMLNIVNSCRRLKIIMLPLACRTTELTTTTM